MCLNNNKGSCILYIDVFRRCFKFFFGCACHDLRLYTLGMCCHILVIDLRPKITVQSSRRTKLVISSYNIMRQLQTTINWLSVSINRQRLTVGSASG